MTAIMAHFRPSHAALNVSKVVFENNSGQVLKNNSCPAPTHTGAAGMGGRRCFSVQINFHYQFAVGGGRMPTTGHRRRGKKIPKKAQAITIAITICEEEEGRSRIAISYSHTKIHTRTWPIFWCYSSSSSSSSSGSCA
jgi:hypothetical protein